MKSSRGLLLLLFVLSAAFDLSAQQGKYSRVKIYTDVYGLRQLAAAGVTIDHGDFKKDSWYISDFSATEIATMQRLGFHYDIVIDDVKQFYKTQNTTARTTNPAQTQAVSCTPNAPNFAVPSHFTYGSMGGFYTYSELLAQLDTMAALYPNLVKVKAPLDSNLLTREGRYVYWVKISDNPNVDENEPEGLYTALHHAREPASASQLIMYMYYLLEHYNSDPEVQAIVNNTELYFIPCLNPDGYLYNESTDPNGGGMWRKNRRNNGDGTFGVDLNRNYGLNWGFDNVGSSNQTSSDTYRGDAGFSEPETQLSRDFCNAHNFRLALNCHTYGNLLVTPWGYQASLLTPDSAAFTAYGNLMTRYNQYAVGTPDQTVGYTANGTSDDWMYGEQSSKPKIFSMTPEAGDQADGFWPQQSNIIPFCVKNLDQNLDLARLLLAYAQVKDEEPRYITTTSGYLNYNIRRLGLDSPATYTVTITPLSPWITSVGAPRTYSTMSLLQSLNDSIAYTVNASTPQGTALQYVLEVNNGLYSERDTLTKIFGATTVVFASDGNTLTGWTSSTGWNTTTSSYYSAPASITDSPNGDYGQNANTRITMTTQHSLANAISATLTFRTHWELEAGYDYAEAQVSTDNGVTWTALCGKYTMNNSSLDAGNPVFNGVQSSWVKEEMNLDSYIGQNILLRFRLRSDFGGQFDGFYFDDLLVEMIDSTVSVGIGEHPQTLSLMQNMPNPADDYTYINLTPSKEDLQLELFDAVGRLVRTETIAAGTASLQLNTTALNAGVYFYRVAGKEVQSPLLRLCVLH